jgi:uncharacterized DUF497 family protein
MRIIFDENKNKKLLKKRGVNFKTVIDKMANGEIALDFEHPNHYKYPNQRIMVILINDYTYCVPYVQTENEIFLKTVYPDRRFKKIIGDRKK